MRKSTLFAAADHRTCPGYRASRPDDIYYDSGVTDLNERWGTSPSSFPVDETIRRIETAGAWIAIKRAEHDPAYAKLLADCMSDILEVGGHELERNMRYKKVDVFVTSPKRVTTYHIDSESGFLLQIAGSKEISLFRSDDREVLPEEESNNSGLSTGMRHATGRICSITPIN